MCDALEQLQIEAERVRQNFKEIELRLLEELKNKKGQEYISFRGDLERYYYKYIIGLARKYEFRDSVNTLDDYVTQGLIGLYQAFELYNPKEAVRLLSFGTIYITNKMDDLLIKTKGLSKNDYFRILKVKKTLEEKYSLEIKNIEKEQVLNEIKNVFQTSLDGSKKIYGELYGFLLENTTYVSLEETIEINAENTVDLSNLQRESLKNLLLRELDLKDTKKYHVYINELKRKYNLGDFNHREKIPTKKLYRLFEEKFIEQMKLKYQNLEEYHI